MVTLSETAPAMMRKEAGKYIVVLVPLILKMMTDLEDDPEWSISDEITEDDNDRLFFYCILFCIFIDIEVLLFK